MINELIDKRYSPRAFSNKMVSKEQLSELFTAASYAASAFNEQPWRFIYATQEQPEKYNQLLNCLNDGNKIWAKKAPVLIVTIAKMRFSKNNKPNNYAIYDLGQAVATMAVQATQLGLYMHQMAGFSVEKAKNNLDIPGGYSVITMIALGNLGEKKDLPDNFQQSENQPRMRNAINEFVKNGTWEQNGI
ncbi:MAG: nitroreductase [Chlorobi bacterium]|nr:nitroreductase [Chlorobiota bacterium]